MNSQTKSGLKSVVFKEENRVHVALNSMLQIYSFPVFYPLLSFYGKR